MTIEQEVFKSSTSGNIPVSRKGRDLLIALRNAHAHVVRENRESTFPVWSTPALSEARADIVRYISSLEVSLNHGEKREQEANVTIDRLVGEAQTERVRANGLQRKLDALCATYGLKESERRKWSVDAETQAKGEPKFVFPEVRLTFESLKQYRGPYQWLQHASAEQLEAELEKRKQAKREETAKKDEARKAAIDDAFKRYDQAERDAALLECNAASRRIKERDKQIAEINRKYA